jgi:hypothetical protein
MSPCSCHPRRHSPFSLPLRPHPNVEAATISWYIGQPAVCERSDSPPPPADPRTLSATGNASPRPFHRIRLVPHLGSRRSLKFDPICRGVKTGDAPLRIGRFTDRSDLGIANGPGSNKLAFKSKVVSRAHTEIWVENGGKFFIRDTKSSSATFLNHVRLSPANAESPPFTGDKTPYTEPVYA